MTEDKRLKVGRLIERIGAEGAAIVGGNPEGTYIYAEVEPGVVFASVFKEESQSVRYFDCTSELSDLIMDAWEAENPDDHKRWTVLEYEVRGGKFDVHLTYSDELNPRDHASDRLELALRKRYGTKPVVYPPIPERFEELRRD